MVDVAALCLHCMTDKGGRTVCAHCGAEPGGVPRSPLALPERALLNDRFVVGRVLGRPGGFGLTYLVWDKVLEIAAAIKEFLPLSSVSRETGTFSVQPNSEQDARLFKRGLQIFMKEASTLAQFSHPNIIRIRDCFSANNTAYLVMDYHRGEPLDQFVKRAGGRLSEARALGVMLPILDGLSAVHDKNFLHRDIKPQNIYVTEQGTPILLDFGAARMALADASKTMTIILSAGFAPFEQYHKKGPQGPWSDIYACAATLYYMVTGKVPNDAIERQQDDRLLPPLALNRALSKGLSTAIMQALAIAPTDRPQTVQAFRQALTGVTGSIEIGTIATERQASTPNATRPLPVRAHTRTVIQNRMPARPASRPNRGLLLALLLFVATLVWYRWAPDSPPPDGQMMTGGAEIGMTPPAPAAAPEARRAAPLAAAPEPVAVDEPRIEPAPLLPWRPEVRAELAPPPLIGGAESHPERGYSRPLPPRFAFDACRGKRAHATCEIRSPKAWESGRCETFDPQGLACVPISHRNRSGMGTLQGPPPRR